MGFDPINVYDFEAKAKQVLPRDIWDYIAGGTGDEITLRKNREAFEKISLRPRRLVDVRNRDLSTTVLGHQISFPVIVAPADTQKFAHPDGELATTRAAGAAGTIMAVSTGSAYSIEDIAAVATGPLWFQLYFYNNEMTQMFVKRAEGAGYSVLCVTVDLPVPTPKECDLRNRYKRPKGIELANFTGEFVGPELVQDDPELLHSYAPSLVTWSDINWLRSITEMPIVLKGIVTAEDANLCVKNGIDGIIVSNHGGRALDGERPTIEALPEVVDAVKGRCEVYLDSGIRRGSDIVKALALGARAVFVGRPLFWGLAVDGEEGARKVLEILRHELDLSMAHCGATTIAGIGRSLVEVPKRV